MNGRAQRRVGGTVTGIRKRGQEHGEVGRRPALRAWLTGRSSGQA